MLLDETPIIYPYFYDYLSATQKNVTGVYPTAIGELFLWNASKPDDRAVLSDAPGARPPAAPIPAPELR